MELSGDRLRLGVRHWRDGRFAALTDTEWRRTADGWRT
jgi:hypothetical protein